MRGVMEMRGLCVLLLALVAACSSTVEKTVPAVQAANRITGPQDLPYYDVAWAKALTLDAMNARVVSRDNVDGIDILAVQYDAFDQPVAAATGVKVVRWRQRGTLVLPAAPLRLHKALAINVHDGEAGSKDNARSFLSRGIAIARAFGIPVLIHGWLPDVVAAVDGKGVHDQQTLAMNRLLAERIESADKLPMDGRYLFNGNPLAKADMVSLTLLQRLVQRERGVEVGELASLGISKEGASHWILGAVDDRITVLGAGGYYAHDSREIYDRYGKDTGWRFPWKDGNRPEYGGLLQLFSTYWKFCDWIESTEAGQLVGRTTMDPAKWYSQIKSKHVLVFGDLGYMPDQHDGPWPFWAEKKPLATFKHPSWRYVRVYGGSGINMDERGIDEMGLSMLPQLADLLVNDDTLPATPAVVLTQIGERQVKVTAKAQMTPGLHHEALVLYAMSAERGLRDRESWHVEPMHEAAAGTWELVLPVVPEGQGLTTMVVVREQAAAGELKFWRSASSLPVEQFAVPEFNLPGPRWRE